ncbi:tetratricopeptide repeat protein [Vacuolonema iberomarrocanum]|uniref:tetratricopeptide repeat protein n=1 Tax=Vacuolonema iberomarrocanum TaxID=3454632 RepID=UPI0019DF6059|nr:tetratricopeptide repeat protein [filamentous cyanobacterium LEGE 07170]
MTSAQSTKAKTSDIIKRLFMIGCLGAFAGSFLAGLIPLYLNQSQPEAVETTSDGLGTEAHVELRQRERGYEIVLEREPDNQIALEGLAKTRLDLGDPNGAIAPLEMLVAVYPDRADYQEQLATAKQQAANETTQP